MRRSSRLILTALVAVALATAGTAARADEFPPAGTYKWRFYMPWGPGPWMSEPLRKFITEEIPRRTNGALQITWYYPGEHPYAFTDILIALQEGAAQMGVTLGSYSGGLDARLEAHELPFLFPRADTLKYLEFLDVLQREIWDPLLEKSWGVKIAAMQLHPPNQLLSDVAVDRPNALVGKKIRSFGLTGNMWIEALGGTGVSIAYGETGTALATGTVDGAISSIDAMHGAGWTEHKRALSLIDIFINPQWELVSLDAYNKLDPVTRKAFDEAMADAQKMLREGYLIADYESLRDAQLRFGVTSSSPPRELREQMAQHAKEKIWPAWINRAGKDGEAILSRIQALSDGFDWR